MMLTVQKTLVVKGAAKASRAAPRAAAGRKAVVCKASAEGKKLSLAGVSAAVASFMASPAFALVDDRMNGDGTGKALGVNDPILGAHLLGVFTTIWALYYIANTSDAKIISGGKEDDSGLSL